MRQLADGCRCIEKAQDRLMCGDNVMRRASEESIALK